MPHKNVEFFLPFEFDSIPIEWDPWNDTWSTSKKSRFIWDCFIEPPFDGLLISKPKLDENLNYIEKQGNGKNLKEVLNLPSNIKLFGDCGAFQYRNQNYPPYTVEEILTYYQDYGFDMGCSIDHIITNKKDLDLRIKRYNITKNLAKECIEQYKSNNYSFKLFGVAQGWDIDSYKKAVEFLYSIGYENICIGGLVGVYKKVLHNPNDLTLINLIKQLAPFLRKFNKVHIFGRGNLDLIKLYAKSSVNQFDNNLMRKSWTDEKRSYQIFDTNRKKLLNYTSIRIRIIKRKMGKSKEELGIFKKLEEFSNDAIFAEGLFITLKNYNQFYRKFKLKEISEKMRNEPDNKKLYKKLNYYEKNQLLINQDMFLKLLEDRPWEKCECELCKESGIHICVFRRRIRNLRRAFHNVHNYYLALDCIRNNLTS